MGFGLRDWFLRTVEAEVNQFRQLCENDGKGTEIEIAFITFRSFSVVFQELAEQIDDCLNLNCEGTESLCPSPIPCFP